MRLKIEIVALIAIALRLLMVPLLSNDMQVYWIPWMDVGTRDGLSALLAYPTVNYPPLFLIWLWLSGHLLGAVHVSVPLAKALMVKSPAFLCDGIAAASLYWLHQEHKNRALLIAAIWLFNPVVLYDSGPMGQIDSIYTSLLFIGLVALVYEQYALAAVLVAVALNVKAQSIVLMPLFAYVAFRRSLRSFITGASCFCAVWAPVIAFVWIDTGDMHAAFNGFLSAPHHHANLSNNAFNLWWLFSRLTSYDSNWLTAHATSDMVPYHGMVPFYLGLAAFVVTCATVLTLLRDWSLDRVLFAASLITLAFYVLLTEMCERYSFGFFLFMLPVAMTQWRLLSTYVVLSLTTAINYFTSVPAIGDLGDIRTLVQQISPTISLIDVLGFAYLLYAYVFQPVSTPLFNANLGSEHG